MSHRPLPLTLALVLALVAGCQSAPAAPLIPTPTPTAAAAAPVVTEVLLGDVLPLTGLFASVGRQELWAAQTVEAIVNNPHPDLPVPLAAGAGLPGLDGARLKLVVRDDASEGERARTIAEQLITIDHVHWLNGDGISDNTALVQPVAEAHAVPFSCHTCSAPGLTEGGLRWFWRSGPSDRSMTSSLFQFLREWPRNGGPAGDARTAALVSCETASCQQERREIAQQAARAGILVAADLTAPVGVPSLAAEVERLRQADADVLFLVLDGQGASVLQADARQAGWRPRLVVVAGGAFSDSAWLHSQKQTNDAVGWFGREPLGLDVATRKPGWQGVNALYKTFSNGQDMSDLAMREVTGLLWSLDTINRARSVEPPAIAAAARQTHTPADQLIVDYGGIAFDDHQQNTLATGVVSQLGRDGDKHTVWPWVAAGQTGYQPIVPSEALR